jgi:hypothetical protein
MLRSPFRRALSSAAAASRRWPRPPAVRLQKTVEVDPRPPAAKKKSNKRKVRRSATTAFPISSPTAGAPT